MSSERYRNAGNILPPALLREVQKYARGRLYIPFPTKPAERHRLQVLALHAQGFTQRIIAQRVRISQRRVEQILQAERQCQQATRRRSLDPSIQEVTP